MATLSSKSSDAAVRRALLWAGRFFFVDSGLNWALWGMLCVLLVKYLTLYHKGKAEKRWQMCSVVIVFTLNTINVAINLARMILSNASHYDSRTYKNQYRRRIIVPLSWFLGLLVIYLVQVLVLHRLLCLARRLHPRLSAGRKVAFIGLFCLDTLIALIGVLAYSLVMQKDEFSDIVKSVKGSRSPPFLVLQISWSSGSVVIVALQALLLHLEIRRTRALSRANGHLDRNLTDEVLQHMHRGFIINWSLVAGAHVIYLASLTSQQASLAGRAAASLSSLYVFGLLAQLIQPRETRNRQLLEARRDSSTRPRERSHRRPRKAIPGGCSAKRGKRMAPILRDTGSVCKTVALTSYATRESDFGDAPDIEAYGAANDMEGENDLALVDAHRLGLGNAVWVEAQDGRRQLSANTHHEPSSTRPAGVLENSRSRSPFRQPHAPTLSFASPVSPRKYLRSPPPVTQNRAPRKMSFIDSFPAGPTTTKSVGVFDPDDFTLSFAGGEDSEIPTTAPV